MRIGGIDVKMDFESLGCEVKSGKEIEHKFLIKDLKALKKKLREAHSRPIDQGYLSRKPVVRVRTIGQLHAFITIKGKGCRIRDEFEYRIPLKDAKKLLKLCGKKRISKTRYYLGPWEIDCFKGRHKGLWLAEIELKSTKAKLPKLPSWIGKEVTYSSKYTNASLAEK